MNKAALTVVAMIWLVAGTAYAFDVNDCVINGMKGVASDVAAREVKDACYRKLNDFKRTQDVAPSDEYGVDVGVVAVNDFPIKENSVRQETPGFQSVEFINKLGGGKTITFVRLGVVALEPALSGCFPADATTYRYKVTVKPLSTARLLFPAPEGFKVCLFVQGIQARPAVWNDISSGSVVRPTQ